MFDNNEARINSASLLLLAKQNTRKFNRLGMIVGKKTLPKAFNRNRIKRHLRESFRQLDPLSLDIVVLVRPGVCFNTQVRKTIVKSLDNLKQKTIT